MTTTDYAISAALVLLVVPQLRGMRITPRSLLLPLAAVAAAAAYYLKALPTTGHDPALYTALGAVGIALGVLTGLATRVHRDPSGRLVSKATAAAAALWIIGMASRTAFAYEATHGGARAIDDFSRTNQITGPDAWTTALVLMALLQVIARLIVIRLKARAAAQADATAPATAAA